MFSNTGWIERRLSPSEILRLLDISKILDDTILKDRTIDEFHSKHSDILQSVPGKIVLGLLERLNIWNKNEDTK